MKNFNLMNWLRKYKNAVMIATMGGFLISTFVGFGLYVGMGSSANDTALEINGTKIPYRSYQSLFNRIINGARNQGQEVTPQILAKTKDEAIQSLIQETVFTREAERFGIQVTDVELANSLASIPAFQKNGKFDAQAYVQALQYGLRTTPEEFEESQKTQILINRLRAFIIQGVKIGDRELELEFNEQVARMNGKERNDTIAAFQKNPEEFREKVRQQKTAQLLNRWYQQLGSNLQIKSNIDELENKLKGRS